MENELLSRMNSFSAGKYDVDKELADSDNGVSDNLQRSDDIDLHEENNGTFLHMFIITLSNLLLTVISF